MSGMPLLGILLGLVVESANWIKSRWDFSTETTNRAWQFNVLVIGLATVWVFLIETPYLALPILIAWLPALLLPMQLIQSFGLIASLPLSTFSFLAKNRKYFDIYSFIRLIIASILAQHQLNKIKLAQTQHETLFIKS